MTAERESILKDLENKIWKTKGSRFNAARRLQSRKTWGSYLVSAYSIYILSISIFLLTQSTSNGPLNLSTIFGSLLILVFSLHEGSLNAEQKAERHHVCAKDLTALYDKVVLRIKQSNDSDAESLIRQYAEIIDRCPENHETIDYDLFRTEHEQFKLNWFQKKTIQFEHGLFKKTCLSIIVIPPIILSISLVI